MTEAAFRSELQLTAEDRTRVVRLAERLTGSAHCRLQCQEVLLLNLAERMRRNGLHSLEEYILFLHTHEQEYSQFVSALTIHTTRFFRELPHFVILEEFAASRLQRSAGRPFCCWSAACSTGQEVFTIAMVLEKLRRRTAGFDYRVLGTDIDPVSIAWGRRGVFSAESLAEIPESYRSLLMVGEGKTRGLFTFVPEVRRRCSFAEQDVLAARSNLENSCDAVFCRNLLIYFTPEKIERAVSFANRALKPRGLLVLGHSEALQGHHFPLLAEGNSTYLRLDDAAAAARSAATRTLIVDDSPTMRQLLLKLFGAAEFHGTAVASTDEADAFLRRNQVDLITLDLQMPGRSGLEWLEGARTGGLRVPVVIVSDSDLRQAQGVIGALAQGAQDFIEKKDLLPRREEIVERFRQIVEAHRDQSLPQRGGMERACLKLTCPRLFVIGASTGGPQALGQLLQAFPRPAPPMVVAQHISAAFARPLAERLAEIAGLDLGMPEDGAVLRDNTLYMAWGDHHLGVQRAGEALQLKVSQDPPVKRQRPSVDYLFSSAARLRVPVMALLLTGMGSDGAHGLLELRMNEAITLAQDRNSCVVFGMPREAIKMHAAQAVGGLEELRRLMEEALATRS